ncbi:MAG: hypothetical protein GVY29_10255 [Spirochaetes bacterium]|nr:hypothetical protein [Spirochaetota bacterium]
MEKAVVAIDAAGNAVAAFQQSDGTNDRAYASVYNGTSCGTATAIDPGAGVDTSAPSIALDAGGNAFAVFLRVFDSENGDISAYAATYLDGSWSTAEEISVPLNPNNGEVRNVTVAADEIGGAAVKFEQMLASDSRVYVTLFDEEAWTSPQIVDAGDTVAADPRIAAGPKGEAVIVFSQFSSYYRVYANVLER